MEEEKIYSTLISKLNYISNNFNKYKKSHDTEGYLYMVSNPEHNVYNIPVYMIDKNYNMNEKTSLNKIIKSVKVPYINVIYELLKIVLEPNQITKKFYTEEKIIKKELEKIKSSFYNKEALVGLEMYINYVLSSLNKKYESISNYVKMRNLNKIKTPIEIKCVNEYKGKIIKKSSNKNTLEEIKNYSSEVRKYGFIIIIESEELTKYYSSKINSIIVCEKWKELINEKYVLEPKITSSRIYNYELAELLIEDLLGKYKVNTNNYLCGIEKINEVYNKVVSYYEKYDTIEKIKQSYLFEEHKIGNVVKEEKNFNPKVYIEKNHLKKLKDGKKDKEISEDEVEKVCMKTKTRYEMICEKLEKNKKNKNG